MTRGCEYVITGFEGSKPVMFEHQWPNCSTFCAHTSIYSPVMCPLKRVNQLMKGSLQNVCLICSMLWINSPQNDWEIREVWAYKHTQLRHKVSLKDETCFVPQCRRWPLWWEKCCLGHRAHRHLFAQCSEPHPAAPTLCPDWHCRNLREI